MREKLEILNKYLMDAQKAAEALNTALKKIDDQVDHIIWLNEEARELREVDK